MPGWGIIPQSHCVYCLPQSWRAPSANWHNCCCMAFLEDFCKIFPLFILIWKHFKNVNNGIKFHAISECPVQRGEKRMVWMVNCYCTLLSWLAHSQETQESVILAFLHIFLAVLYVCCKCAYLPAEVSSDTQRVWASRFFYNLTVLVNDFSLTLS